MTGVNNAHGILFLQPAGVSAALEAAYAKGKGKPVVVLGKPREPDLMLKMFDHYARDLSEALHVLHTLVYAEN
jgi:hypothetical protein